ncbi:hypothetical protein [Pseudobacteriovorax antillogorgiicola]|uniref:Tyrosine-protein kinase ephrin type A/B receptor-like domain-containing protein n=1 Tax=Pseudobacteriovorax antillogorgiicola TaxID=1513793 RepID=A0A1Y6BU67_9BACT|nr:hypothetical protein [Pseudobacteriovorax antillogorgiicola]TCS52429.1 hypothetical protein EDD56_109174 [Pseudobacteriovorax antillogorgiicola]SMF28736.1 hypothetical protein SAMN06296036_10939 [Pseudobacteriovorax antillogorgiicola]
MKKTTIIILQSWLWFVGSAAAAECPAGNFADGLGACQQCPAGTYAEEPGSEQCTVAQPGAYVPHEGERLTYLCPEGTYSEVFGAVSCKPCEHAQGLGNFRCQKPDYGLAAH